MTDKKISPHIERFKTLQDYAQYFIDEKGKTPNVSCVDEPVEVVKFAEQKPHPDYIRTDQDTYNIVVYDDYDYTSPTYVNARSQVCTQSIMYKFVYDSNTGVYSQYDFIAAPTPSPSNGISQILQYIYPTKIFEDFEGTITRSVNLDSTTKYDATTTASYKAIHRTLGNKDINIFQISCASETVALNEKIEFPGGHMYYPSPVYTIESMNDDVILDDGFLFGGHTFKILKQDDRHFILGLDDEPLSNNRFDLPAILIPFHYKDLPELTFFKYFDEVNLPVLTEEKPQAEFEFYLNIYGGTPQKVEANDLVYKQYSPGFNVTYEGKKLYADYRIEDADGDNKMLGSVELDGSALEQGMASYLWEPVYLTSGAHELVAYDGEHNEIGRMTFNVKMPQFDYVLYDSNKNLIEPDEISRYNINTSDINNDYIIDIHGIYDGKMYKGASEAWANDNMFNEEITDWRDYIVLSPKVNNHNLEAYYEPDAAGASELFKLKPSWCSSDTRYNIIDGNNNIAEICFYYETFTPHLENGDLTVANLWKVNNGLYYRPSNYFYYVDEYGQRNKTTIGSLSDNSLSASYDTNIIEPSKVNILGTQLTGWRFKQNIDIPAGDYKITNAYLEYNGLRLDLWSEATLTHADNPSTYIMKNANDETINTIDDLSWTYNSSDATATKTSEPFKFIKHDIDDDPQEVDITREVTASINADIYYDASLFNIEISNVDGGDYYIISITPKAELGTIRKYNAGDISFTYNNNLIKYISNDYVPQNGSMQIYIVDPMAVDNMDREIHSFTSSATDTLTYDNYVTCCDDPNYQGDSVTQTITTTGTGITVEYPYDAFDLTGFKLTLQPNASGTITITYQKSANTDFVPDPRTYNITAPVLKKVISGPLTAKETKLLYDSDTTYDSIVYATNTDNKCELLTKNMLYDSENGIYKFELSSAQADEGLYQIYLLQNGECFDSVEYVGMNEAYVNFFLTYGSQLPNFQGYVTFERTDNGLKFNVNSDINMISLESQFDDLLKQVGQDLTINSIVITTRPNTNNDYLDYKASTEGGWGNRKLYGLDNNVVSNNGTYEFAIFDESGANHTFNYSLDIKGNAEIRSTETTDADDPRGEGLVLKYKIAISGQASLRFNKDGAPYVAVRFNM